MFVSSSSSSSLHAHSPSLVEFEGVEGVSCVVVCAFVIYLSIFVLFFFGLVLQKKYNKLRIGRFSASFLERRGVDWKLFDR